MPTPSRPSLWLWAVLGLVASGIGPTIPLAVLGYRAAPNRLRRALLFVVPQLFAAWTFAFWAEVRLLLPATPVVLPLIALGLERLVDGEAPPGCGQPTAKVCP